MSIRTRISRHAYIAHVASSVKVTISCFHFGRMLSNVRNMEDDILLPPKEVRGMKVLDRNLFCKTIKVPWILFPVSFYSKCLKKYTLKLENLKPMQELDVHDTRNLKSVNSEIDAKDKNSLKKIFLNPQIVKSYEDINENDRIALEKHGITSDNFYQGTINLTYDNWKADEILKSILPSDKGNLSSYSKIGHIIHVNLKENLLEYKNIIGQILFDKVSGARTVVNKIDSIDNTYRNFQMEVLCGENDMKAQVRENHCIFEFDFSSVYWNPRLCTEHERILSYISPGDILFDVFAGVGPFSIPAARYRKCSLVMANDLNPESYRWLLHNASLNKVLKDKFKVCNKDGWKFIVEDVAPEVQKMWEIALDKDDFECKMHVVMNLPGRATEFLGSFCGLFSDQIHLRNVADKYPLKVHVYCFVGADSSHTEAVNLVENNIDANITSKEVKFVRKVSPSKDMLRVTFELPTKVLFANKREQLPQPSSKRICLEKTESCATDFENGEAKNQAAENKATAETDEEQQNSRSIQGSGCS